MLTFWQPYLFFHSYDHLGIPCLASVFVLANANEILSDTNITNTLHWVAKYLFFISITTYVFLVWYTYTFSSFMPICFETVQTCESIHYADICVMLNDSCKFIFLAAIFVLSHL